jgi:hypothetical protein
MRVRELAEHPLGVTWIIDEAMQRASHALAHDGRVWLVDPTDAAEALERAAALGEPAAVLQLFVAHGRDGEAIAKRLGVPFQRLPELVRDSPFSVISLDKGPWKERALWWPDKRGLVVPETIGTTPYHTLEAGPVGVHPFLRLLPPARLRTFVPEHLLVGHGAPVHGGDAGAGLLAALHRSRRDIPAMFWKAPGLMRRMRARS